MYFFDWGKSRIVDDFVNLYLLKTKSIHRQCMVQVENTCFDKFNSIKLNEQLVLMETIKYKD